MDYSFLRTLPARVRRRTAERLSLLRDELAVTVPRRTVEDTLLLATWNVREFDSSKYGARCDECFFYIAEIISRFDLVAMQEVRDDLAPLVRLVSILGGGWDFIVSDVTDGLPGNGERMAFLFDRRKVEFDRLAGEIVLPAKRTKAGEERALQFARTPFVCSFRTRWARFELCTVHIYWGKDTPDDPRRVQEIDDLASLLAGRAKKRTRAGDAPSLVLLGDFNIFNHGDATMRALEHAGFVVPPALRGARGSNLDQTRHYDQIAFHPGAERTIAARNAGVFDFGEVVFRDRDEREYAKLMGEAYASKDTPEKKSRYYKQWRTFQMSDHLVLWTELDVAGADTELKALAGTGT